MQCERAQEFFSDYLERTLDRPMAVALESHLSSCHSCREELESLRDLVHTMERVPTVEPLADGAWEVLCRLHRAQAEQWEQERNRKPGFLEWLRGLSPASAAMVGGLATLVIAGSVWYSPLPTYIWNGFGGPLQHDPPASPKRSADMPQVLVSYGPLTAAGQQVTLQIHAATDLPDAHVEVAGASLPMKWEGNGGILRGKPQDLLNTNVPLTSGPVAFRMLVQSKTLGKEFRYLVVVPVGELKEQPVTLAFPPQPLEASLLQLAPSLGRPVVVDAAIEGNVQLRAEERAGESCLEELASQLRAQVTQDSGVYRLAPR